MKPKNKIPRRHFTWGRCAQDDVDKTGEFIKKVHYLPESNTEESKIQKFYNGANIFITGATGFMGKTIVEKLLVSCPNISTIYILIREKKGQNMEQRFSELFNDYMFERLRNTVPDFLKKIVAINGDCSERSLGMSQEDYERLSKTVNVIIHGAATVGFNEPLRFASLINVLGVREMLKFASSCANLKSVVHISTAYANGTIWQKDAIEEKIYPPAMKYQELINLVESHSEEELEKLTPQLIKGWPNTYSFTKQVAEDLIKHEGRHLPLAVFRPGIVSPTYKEPIRGWCDNYYGMIGYLVGVWRGGIRAFPGPYSQIMNIVPVDISVNGVIAVACETANRTKKEIIVYNNTITERNPLTMREMIDWDFKYAEQWPTMHAIWYRVLIAVNNIFMFHVVVFLLQTVPACIADAFLFISGQKTRYVKYQSRSNKFMTVLIHYLHYHWRYVNNNLHDLWANSSEKDKALFPFEMDEVDWDYYSQSTLLGFRTYLLKEPLETIPAAKIKYQRLYVKHMVVLTMLCLPLLWLASHLVQLIFRTYFV